jgi:two-component system cell cycle sensor histidine kinase/response regulator CckA
VEALEAFRVSPDNFDLVITDMTMPNMTGDKLTQEVKAIRSGVPVILCTGFSEQISGDGENLDIDGFLMKPVDKEKMAKMVRKVLNKVKG